MSSEREQRHLTLEEKANRDTSRHIKTSGPCQLQVPVSPIQFSLDILPDDEVATGASIPISAAIDTQKKAYLHVRKFFYPRFKRRACGIVTLGSFQCSVKDEEQPDNHLPAGCMSETLPSMAPTKSLLEQTESSNQVQPQPHEIPLRDIVNCESPAIFLRHGDECSFSPRSCTATPNPINRNSAFRLMETPCLQKYPLLSFTNLEEQQNKHIALPNCSVRSPPDSKRGAIVAKSHESNAVLSSNITNVRLDSGNLIEPRCLNGLWIDEHEKENNPPSSDLPNKAVLVYRSLQKTKRRRKLRPGKILSSRHAGDCVTGCLKMRSYAIVDKVLYSRPLRSGPILRSSQNGQIQRERMTKERSLSAYGSKKALVKSLLEKYLWNWRKCGTPSRREVCLPFLNGEAGRRVECFYCKAFVASQDLVVCSHKGCNRSYHRACGQSLEDFHFHKNGDAVCPQHVCMFCKGYNKLKVLKCERCTVAAHTKCFAFPEFAIFLESKPDCFICWRHPQDWRLESEYKVPTVDTKEAFKRLPLPYAQIEFDIGNELPEEVSGNGLEPTPFVQIRRNIFLVKKKRDDFDDGVGCTCKDYCRDNCECRAQSMSCSKSCTCHEKCRNKPFRKEKRIKLVKTLACGWGVQTSENISKGEFIVQYVGEVINEAMCEERLWTLKERGDQNFYMCEIGKDFIIDATFKGNASRFVNHSCDPNCSLEKWRVDGEIRVGIFAKRDLTEGEALTYDYRFVQFGSTVKCRCGSSNCRGNLGETYQHKRTKHPTTSFEIPYWGEKHRRSQKHQDSTLIETA